MNKLSKSFQNNWASTHIYDPDILLKIDSRVHLHSELENVMSSAASCLNVLGNLANNSDDLQKFLNKFKLGILEIIPFPSGSVVGGEQYNDHGLVVFEWIGPKKSPINERAGKRGVHRTSIDGFTLAIIDGVVTQIFIEWKFSESYSSNEQLQKFAGMRGNERLRRYSSVLARLRKKKDFPFEMSEDGGWGLFDLGYEPFYQLLRMTLLAKTTTPIQIGTDIHVKDYRVLHLSHSENAKLNTVTRKQLKFCPGLVARAGLELHQLWQECLSTDEAERFYYGYWNEHLYTASDLELRNYLRNRYE